MRRPTVKPVEAWAIVIEGCRFASHDNGTPILYDEGDARRLAGLRPTTRAIRVRITPVAHARGHMTPTTAQFSSVAGISSERLDELAAHPRWRLNPDGEAEITAALRALIAARDLIGTWQMIAKNDLAEPVNDIERGLKGGYIGRAAELSRIIGPAT